MIRTMLTAVAALSITATVVSPAMSAACRDPKGKFIKCADAKPAAGTRCKDSKGKFAKCGTPGAVPIAKK